MVAAGTAPLTYQWYFNNGAITNATGASLGMANVHAAQQGNYTVVVTNSAGSVTSSPAALTVVDTTPPVIVFSGANPLTNECHTAFLIRGRRRTTPALGALG